jgi:hypothetical protein
MAQSKSKRTHARASNAGAAGQSKRPRLRGGAPAAKDQSTPRRAPSEYDPEGGTIESGGGKERRDGLSDVSIDEETGALSRRPGGPGDASFGNDDEGPEGPAR